MLRLKKEHIGCQEIYIIESKNQATQLTIISSLGASLYQLRLQNIDWLKTWPTDDLAQQQRTKYPGTQLFPFPNRLAQGEYVVNDQKLQFPHNDFGRPNALHGHLMSARFQLQAWDPNTGKLSLMYNYSGDDPAYPFPYRMHNHFSLTDIGLNIQTDIKNLSDKTIPIGHGWHPYFAADYKLDKAEFPETERLEVNALCIPTGQTTTFDHYTNPKSIKDLELDHCLALGKQKIIKLHKADTGRILKLHAQSYDYLQVYTTPEKDAIALEPQTCAPDAYHNGLGLQWLKPQERISLQVGISVESADNVFL